MSWRVLRHPAIGVALVDDNARSCALPGCAVIIEDIPGRPPRRYCTAAHRAAARQARRASTQSEQEACLAETLPWLREPADVASAPSVPGRCRPAERSAPVRPLDARSSHAGPSAVRAPSLPPPGRSRGARSNEPLPRRRRALAVLGAAGILAGGYAVTASEPAPPPAASPVEAAPQPATEDEWAARAQVTLTSLNRQLDTIAQTEEAWSRLPEERRAATPPALVQAMAERKALLERRKATLQSQIETYRSLSRTKDELRITEQHLQAVEKALQDVPSDPNRTPEQASVIAALDEQRDLRLRQREAKRKELDSLEENVQSAVRTPLPDDGEETAHVSNEVLEVIRTDGTGRGDPGDSAIPPRPEVVGREQQQAQERQETATSAPPDPRGPGDESAEHRGDPDPRADAPGSGGERGPVAGVVDTVGDVGDTLLGGGPGEGKGARHGGERHRPQQAPPTAERPAEQQQAAQDRGPAGRVVDTVSDVGGPLTGGGNGDGRGSGGDRNRAEQAPAAETPAQEPAGALRAQPRVASPAPAASQPAGDDRRAAPADVPGGDIARTVVDSVPGGQLAAPQVEAALRGAAGAGAAAPARTQPEAPRSTVERPTSNAEHAAPTTVESTAQQPTRQQPAPQRSTPMEPAAAPAQPSATTSSPSRSTQQESSRPDTSASGSIQRRQPEPTPSTVTQRSTTQDAGADVVTMPVQRAGNSGSGSATVTRDGGVTTVTRTDGSGTRTVTASDGGYTASTQPTDGSSTKSVTVSRSSPSSSMSSLTSANSSGG
jgi:hypothetical protein